MSSAPEEESDFLDLRILDTVRGVIGERSKGLVMLGVVGIHESLDRSRGGALE